LVVVVRYLLEVTAVYTSHMLLNASHPIWAGMPRLPGLPEVVVCPVTEISEGKPLNISRLEVATHAGTHVDAPRHILPDGAAIDEIGLDRLTGPGVVVPVARQAGEEITVDDVLAGGGEVLDGDIVLLSTGWARQFTEVSYFDHPILSVELAEWLVGRQVKMVGIDCCTVDLPVARRTESFDYPVHRALLGSGTLIIENLADVSAAHGQRVTIYAFPLALVGGDAAHARVVLER